MRISDWSSDVCSSDLRACQEYLDGIDKLGLPHDRIPQLGEINKVLGETTGWQVARVPALIPFQTFFELLASRSEEHTSELQSLMRISYAVFCLKTTIK